MSDARSLGPCLSVISRGANQAGRMFVRATRTTWFPGGGNTPGIYLSLIEGTWASGGLVTAQDE